MDSHSCNEAAAGIASSLMETRWWAPCTSVRAQQGSEEQPLVPPAWTFSGWNFRLFTEKQLKGEKYRNSSSWLRWEFIQWQAYMITSTLNSLWFSLREKQFPHEGFFFLTNISNVSGFVVFFKKLHPFSPAERRRETSKSLLHLSPKAFSIFWKVGCSHGTVSSSQV